MRWTLLLLIAVGVGLAGGARAQSGDLDAQRCGNYKLDADLRIGACTALIRSGSESDHALASTFNDRATAYYDRGDYDRAIADYTVALRLEPDAPEPLGNRCWIHAIRGRIDAALADCNRSIALDPDNPDARDARGLVYLRMNKWAAAIADYDVALRLKPGYSSSLYGRGLAKHRTGDQAGGDADIAAAIKVAPGIAADFARWGVR